MYWRRPFPTVTETKRQKLATSAKHHAAVSAMIEKRILHPTLFSILKRFYSSNAANFSLASNPLVVMMPALVQELLQFFYDIVVGLVIDQVDVLLRVIHQVIQLPEIVRRSPVRCLILGTLIV